MVNPAGSITDYFVYTFLFMLYDTKKFSSAQLIKLIFKFDPIVSAKIVLHALLLTEKISISSMGQRYFDSI